MHTLYLILISLVNLFLYKPTDKLLTNNTAYFKVKNGKLVYIFNIISIIVLD